MLVGDRTWQPVADHKNLIQAYTNQPEVYSNYKSYRMRKDVRGKVLMCSLLGNRSNKLFKQNSHLSRGCVHVQCMIRETESKIEGKCE